VATLAESETTRLWLFDDDLRVQWVADNGPALWKWDAEQVLGRSFAELFGDVNAAAVEPILRRGLVEATDQSVGDTPRARRTMTAFPLEVSGRPHVGLASIMLDAWARTALRELELRNELVTDVAQVGVWERDRTTHVMARNRWVDRLLDTDPDRTLFVDDWASRVHPDDTVRVRNTVVAAVNAGEMFEVVYRVRWRNGEVRLLHSRGELSPTDPNVIVGVLIDVTPGVWASNDQVALQQLAVAATESERMRFAADLHDGPIQDITAASIYLSLMDERLERTGGDPEAARLTARSGEILVRATAQLRRILTELHTLDDDVDAATFVDEVSDLAAQLTHDHGVELTSSFDFDGHAVFRPGLLSIAHRVVAEAMRNAAEHAQASHLTVGITIDGEDLVACVDDDGTGFDTARAHGPDAYGLTLMDRRCRSAGGTLSVRSLPGAGTTVTVRLPLDGPTVPATHQLR
jgi:signal transduction histidine kinase